MNITKRQLKRIIHEMVASRMQRHPSDDLIEELGLHDYIDVPSTPRLKCSTAADIFVEGRIKITKGQLRKIIREQIMHEAEEEGEVKTPPKIDPEALDLPVPKKLEKLLDPDISPQLFARLEDKLRETGSIKHKAFAVAIYAMNFAQGDEGIAMKEINMAKALIPKIADAWGEVESGGGEAAPEGEEGEGEEVEGGGTGKNVFEK